MFLNQNPKLASYEIGAWSYGDLNVRTWGEGASLKLGKFCSIADHITVFLGGEHRTDWISTYPFNVIVPEGAGFSGHPKTKRDVIIGHDVWIGSGAMIMSGVKVGHGAVIGARSVVTRDIPPYGIVAGNPAKLVRYRFSPEVIEELQQIPWWDWDISTITASLHFLLSDNVSEFIREYKE
ncbi:CatB-related O-acetyltransferase [Bacillus mycoides]|uniref:CatB-related O-acetyltransferase n=1 Tax=Bacillus mycoides TaxID=1405 RepID=UPI001C335586|nr:CatB-related O-acetyltransferase [Bacillus mycoides]QWH18588.1 CatB-related O-acetyltransferase [Bacillus mycoides]